MHKILLWICSTFSLSIQSFDGHSAWFHSLAIVGSIAINMDEQVSLRCVDSKSFECTHLGALQLRRDGSIFRFSSNFHTDFHCSCVHLHSPPPPPRGSGEWGSLFPLNPRHSCCHLFSWGLGWDRLRAVLIFQVAKDAERLLKICGSLVCLVLRTAYRVHCFRHRLGALWFWCLIFAVLYRGQTLIPCLLRSW